MNDIPESQVTAGLQKCEMYSKVTVIGDIWMDLLVFSSFLGLIFEWLMYVHTPINGILDKVIEILISYH